MNSEDTNERRASEFAKKLMVQYPSLFYTNEHDQPIMPECGIYCPVGWEPIVESLCEAIVEHVGDGFSFEYKPIMFDALRRKLWKIFFTPIQRLLNPARSLYLKEYPLFPLSEDVMAARKKNKIRSFICYKILNKLKGFVCPIASRKVKVPAVKIGQIKEKFGTLRFYYDGGDDAVRGMCAYANILSSKTCQESGEPGALCKRGIWYKTLSTKNASQSNFTKV